MTRRTRALLLFVSASGYTAWFSGIGERSDAANDRSPSPALTALQHRATHSSIAATISRDPFSGAPAPVETAAPTSSPEIVAAESEGGLDVPNIGDASGAGDASTLVVRATIVGNTSVAYIENGTSMEIVRIGDSIAGERVAAIDLRGLTFTDGTRLNLPDAFSPTPAPPSVPVSLAARIDGIRRLLLPRKAQTAPPAPSAVIVAPATSVAATPSFPSPAPLRTVDARGIPAGTNPTPDANGPTPFPNPYPYAPAR